MVTLAVSLMTKKLFTSVYNIDMTPAVNPIKLLVSRIMSLVMELVAEQRGRHRA